MPNGGPRHRARRGGDGSQTRSEWRAKRASVWKGFTVGRSMLDQVAKYVRNQKEHHREVWFEDEFIDMLRRADIEFDVNEIFK